MKEVKSPKKPLLYYYGIVLLIIIVFNVLVTLMYATAILGVIICVLFRVVFL